MPATAPVAQPDRRFHAFLIDRLLGWGAFGLAAVGAWWLIRDGRLWLGVLVVVAVVGVVSLAFALALGLRGTSPGRAAAGIRVVDVETGAPIGVGRALRRSLIVGVGSLPMFGLGLAALAWTAIEDRTGQRRGWHDHRCGSVVLDVRPQPVLEQGDDAAPVHLVNLTAMRLASAPSPTSQPLAPAPQPAPQPPAPPAPPAPQPHPASPPREQRPAWGPPLTPAPAPPSAPQPAPTPPAAMPGQPTPPQPTPPRPTATAPSDGATIARSAPGRRIAASGWRLTFDTGDTVLVGGLTLVGRSPEGRPGEPVRHAIALPSQDMSLSKTHAQFHLASDGALVVTDRGSTNGSILIRQGVSRDLTAGRPFTLLPGDRVLVGDRSATISHENP